MLPFIESENVGHRIGGAPTDITLISNFWKTLVTTQIHAFAGSFCIRDPGRRLLRLRGKRKDKTIEDIPKVSTHLQPPSLLDSHGRISISNGAEKCKVVSDQEST
jgi:hypothetical protein